MENELKLHGFSAISENEMLNIEGGVDIALIALGGLAIFAVAAAMFTDWINSFKWW